MACEKQNFLDRLWETNSIREEIYQQKVVIQSHFIHILKSYIQFLFVLVSYTLHVVYTQPPRQPSNISFRQN